MKDIFQGITKIWRELFSSKKPETEALLELEKNDRLAKYVFNKRKIKQDGRLRTGELVPREGEMLSMSKVSDLNPQDICLHGHQHVDNPEKNRIHIGYGIFIKDSLDTLELDVIYDNNPIRHVSVGFPGEPEKRREVGKALAEEMIVLRENVAKKYFYECK